MKHELTYGGFYMQVQWRALDEINSGVCDGMTYLEIMVYWFIPMSHIPVQSFILISWYPQLPHSVFLCNKKPFWINDLAMLKLSYQPYKMAIMLVWVLYTFSLPVFKARTACAYYDFCNGLEQNAWVINVSDFDPKSLLVTGHGSKINSDTDIPVGSPTWMSFKGM